MKSLAGGGGKFEVGGQMGAEGVKLGHQRKQAKEVISGEEEIGNTFGIGLRVATVINRRSDHAILCEHKMDKFIT
jgi:hypothetical protein